MQNLPPFIIRLYQPSDFNAVLSVTQASETADALPRRVTAAELRARFSAASGEPRLDPADDSWVAVVREAGVVAYGDCWLVGLGQARTVRTECWVQPAYRGRSIGRALLKRQQQRARAIGRRLSTPEAPVSITLGARAWQRQAGALAVLEAGGLRRARTYAEMSRDLRQPLPSAPLLPGLRLEPWMDHRTDEAVWQAWNEAFADHWGHAAESFERFLRRIAMGHIEREHTFIAFAGGQVAGGSLNEMAAGREGGAGGPVARIHHLFVRRQWRGRGLGRALVAASLARARLLGYDRAALLVDEENATGAEHLYRSTGFEMGERRFMFEQKLDTTKDEPTAHTAGSR